MALMMIRLILAAMLIYLNSAKPSGFFPEDTGDHGKELSQGLQNETDTSEQQVTELPFYCDSKSVIIGVSPTQYTRVYLLRDDEAKISISQLLRCSHVEMQSASLIRIFYEGCSLLSWLGHQEQYTVKLGYTNLNTDTIQTQTCPSPTSAPIQAPAVKCESANMTVTLAAKELQVARFIDLDASSFQEKIMKEGGGLTQWTDGENLVVQVEKPTMEDQAVLLLQYIDILDKMYMAKVFCPQNHPKHLTKREIHTNDSLIDLEKQPLTIKSHKPQSPSPMSNQNNPCVGEIHTTTEIPSITISATTKLSGITTLGTGVSTASGTTRTKTSTLATTVRDETETITSVATTVITTENTTPEVTPTVTTEEDLMTTTSFETSNAATSTSVNTTPGDIFTTSFDEYSTTSPTYTDTETTPEDTTPLVWPTGSSSTTTTASTTSKYASTIKTTPVGTSGCSAGATTVTIIIDNASTKTSNAASTHRNTSASSAGSRKIIIINSTATEISNATSTPGNTSTGGTSGSSTGASTGTTSSSMSTSFSAPGNDTTVGTSGSSEGASTGTTSSSKSTSFSAPGNTSTVGTSGSSEGASTGTTSSATSHADFTSSSLSDEESTTSISFSTSNSASPPTDTTPTDNGYSSEEPPTTIPSSTTHAASPPTDTAPTAAQSTTQKTITGMGCIGQTTTTQPSIAENLEFAIPLPDSFWGFATFPNNIK